MSIRLTHPPATLEPHFASPFRTIFQFPFLGHGSISSSPVSPQHIHSHHIFFLFFSHPPPPSATTGLMRDDRLAPSVSLIISLDAEQPSVRPKGKEGAGPCIHSHPI
ncbi:hypothetical protein ACMYSQ_008356 [Aspergillus niger]